MEIEQIEVGKLIPYSRNARIHSDDQVTELASHIREYGFDVPILIEDDLTIIAGHGRLMAAKKLEMKEVPCIRRKDLNKIKAKARRLSDNKIAEKSLWDFDALDIELEELGFAGVDIKALGFDQSKWESDISPVDKTKENMDGIEAIIKIICKQEQKSELLGFLNESFEGSLFEGVRFE